MPFNGGVRKDRVAEVAGDISDNNRGLNVSAAIFTGLRRASVTFEFFSVIPITKKLAALCSTGYCPE